MSLEIKLDILDIILFKDLIDWIFVIGVNVFGGDVSDCNRKACSCTKKQQLDPTKQQLDTPENKKMEQIVPETIRYKDPNYVYSCPGVQFPRLKTWQVL